jgi:hypothetical protein
VQPLAAVNADSVYTVRAVNVSDPRQASRRDSRKERCGLRVNAGRPRIVVRRECSLAVVMRVRCNAMHEGSVRTHAAIGGVQGCMAAARVAVV